MNEQQSLALLLQANQRLQAGFASLPPVQTASEEPELAAVLDETAQRLTDNYPYFHPLYAGQMMKPPHPVARLAYALAMSINPNNHALDGGRASSIMEKEAVAQLAAMFGWKTHLGHLCSGGTMANLEALWIASQLHPGQRLVASSQAHYTHERVSGVLGIQFQPVPVDNQGRMEVSALKKVLNQHQVGTVVVTLGTTAVGAIDPLPEILHLRREHGFRVHVDAAYGGYFGLADNLSAETRAAYDLLGEVDSLVIDPHKHGLQPYGCGSVLFRDPGVGRFYKHDSPYTYFSSAELHLGEISLECSRPGAAAVALWATQRLLPLVRDGKFAGMLSDGRAAALDLYERLAAHDRFLTAAPPALDIVVWAVRAPKVSAASVRARRLFAETARRGLHLALVHLPVEFILGEGGEMERDQPVITCLRSVLMKPEHRAWIDQIWKTILEAMGSSL